MGLSLKSDFMIVEARTKLFTRPAERPDERCVYSESSIVALGFCRIDFLTCLQGFAHDVGAFLSPFLQLVYDAASITHRSLVLGEGSIGTATLQVEYLPVSLAADHR